MIDSPSLEERLHAQDRSILTDLFGRRIDYLRVSVTDRCNFRCVYCMPEQGFPPTPKEEQLTFDEIVRLVRIAAGLGMSKIRLTGGEPLLRNDIVDLVGAIAELPGVEDLSCTTNGFLLAEKAEALMRAGLHRVNVSLDTLRPDRFAQIARRGEIRTVLDGISAALGADSGCHGLSGPGIAAPIGNDAPASRADRNRRQNLQPVKINCVALKGMNDDEFADFAAWSQREPVHVRFIELMPMRWNLDETPELRPLGKDGLLQLRQAPGDMLSDAEMRRRFIAAGEIRTRIEEIHGPLEDADIPTNGPARTYRIPGAQGTIGFISQITSDFCARCNRLRLTADGFVRPCLMSDGELDLRTALRDGRDDEDIADLFRRIVAHKPERHYLADGQRVTGRGMSQIGG